MTLDKIKKLLKLQRVNENRELRLNLKINSLSVES